jgi:glutathione peroxidase
MTIDEAAVDHTVGVIDHTVTTSEGDAVDLRGYHGRPILIVNTASKCGFTKQYETLQKLYERFEDRGFVIVGFPSNDFGNQEPGTHEEIANFCRLNYGVTFPMMAKVHTKGPDQAPIYRALTTESPEDMRGEIGWNFTKFLVDGEGRVVARFEPGLDPMSDEIVDAVEELLSAES